MAANSSASASGISAVFFDLDNTLVQTRKVDSLVCQKRHTEASDSHIAATGAMITEQMSGIMERDFGIPCDVATRASETFLKQFRLCPENPSLGLDDWRLMLWSEALGDDYQNLAEVIYLRWRRLRYKFLAPSESVISLLTQLGHTFDLALITNGPSHSQWEKIREMDLEKYFACILVSGDLPWEKPHPAIFLRACEILGVKPQQCVMVGDKIETDIIGARQADLGAVVYIPVNPLKSTQHVSADWIISEVEELVDVLNIASTSGLVAASMKNMSH